MQREESSCRDDGPTSSSSTPSCASSRPWSAGRSSTTPADAGPRISLICRGYSPNMAAREGSRAGIQGEPRTEVRFLGGLRVLVEGRPVDLPAGAPTVALAVVALRRVVHVEEVTDVLWP